MMHRIAEADAVHLVDATSTEVREAVPARGPFGPGNRNDRPGPAIDCLAVTAPWLAARAPEEAVREIAEAAADPTGLGSLGRALGSGVLGSAGEEVVPELRALLGSDRRTAAGLAAGALLSRPELPEQEAEALNDEYGLWPAIDRMPGPLEMGEEGFVDLLGLATEEGSGFIEQLLVDRTEQLWKVDHPATPEVLAVARG